MSISLQQSIVYGPIESRRLGRSLGINILPTDRKLCTMDCVYCQYGKSTLAGAARFPTLAEIEEAIRQYFKEAKEKNLLFDSITVAGNGEPTLYPEFEKVAQLLYQLRDEYYPKVKLSILSNSLSCKRPSVLEGLRLFDQCVMKLDAGSQDLFEKINRPLCVCQWQEIVENLQQLGNLVIQSMFVQGSVDNTTDKAVDDWIHQLEQIDPIAVQIYTLDREPQEATVKKVSSLTMDRIAEKLYHRTLIPATVY